MTEVLQRKARDRYGDCFPACVASILEVPLEDVPHPYKIEYINASTWQFYLRRLSNEYLSRKNLYLVAASPDSQAKWVPRGHSILTLTNPGYRHRAHSVVAHDGKVIWDPSPYKQILTLKLYWVMFLQNGQQPFCKRTMLETQRRRKGRTT